MDTRKFIKKDRNLSGQKNNLLTAISKFSKNGRWYWLCSCDCGGQTSIREDFFISGKTKSCGCFGSRNSIYKINQKLPGESTFNSIFRAYVISAKKRNYSFDLSKYEFKKLIEQECFYCGVAPVFSPRTKNEHGTYYANGIDRINNKLGYVFENCVTCCKSCNIAKASMSLRDFYLWINRLHENLQKQDRLKILQQCLIDFSKIWES